MLIFATPVREETLTIEFNTSLQQGP